MSALIASEKIARLGRLLLPGSRDRSADASSVKVGPARVPWIGWKPVLWLATTFVLSSTGGTTALLFSTRQQGRVMGAAGIGGLMILGLAVALTAVMRQRERAASERDQARTVLENAIEAMADGFVIWDQNDRLVTCNARYRELYARIAPIMKPGVSYRDVLAYGVQSGQYPEADGRVDQFLSHTMAWHRSDGGALERSLPDGTWLLITDRLMADGCVVGMRTDITAVKTAQSDLAAARDLARAAMTEVQQQNIILTEREEALESQYLRFDAALNNMSHGLLMADAGQKLIVCNRRFLQLFDIEAAGGDGRARDGRPFRPYQKPARRRRDAGRGDLPTPRRTGGRSPVRDLRGPRDGRARVVRGPAADGR